MKKIFIYIIPLFVISLFLNSCSDNTTNPVDNTPTTGSIWVFSTPSGAQIWVDGQNTNKVTSDSVTSLSTGSHSLTLKLNGYRDTTLSVNVTAGVNLQVTVILTSTLSYSAYGPVRIYETTGTTANQPSGLILKNGTSSGISSTAPNQNLVDLFYYSNTTPTYDLRSANLATGLNRATYFSAGNSNNLYDGVSSPVKDGSWIQKINDRDSSKYYFVFDQDGHYSKFKVVNWGGGTGPGDPSWVDVRWIYNNTASDQRFPAK